MYPERLQPEAPVHTFDSGNREGEGVLYASFRHTLFRRAGEQIRQQSHLVSYLGIRLRQPHLNSAPIFFSSEGGSESLDRA